MVIYILFDHFICNIATRYTKISSAPKMPAPISFSQLWKFLLNFSGASALHRFYQVALTNMRWNRYKNMYMFRGNNAAHYLHTKFFSNLNNYFANTPLQISSENFIAVFGYPNNVKSMMIFGMRPFAISFHTISITSTRLEVEGFKPFRGL